MNHSFRIWSLLLLLSLHLPGGSAEGGVAVVGSLVRTKAVNPGDTFEGIVLLRNTGSMTTEVHVSQTDYLFYSDGRDLYGEPGRSPRSNASWITVTPSQVSIASNETAEIVYRGKVPERKDLSGTYWSMLMVQPMAARGSVDGAGVHLQTVVRFGVQIVTEVGNAAGGTLRVMDKRLVRDAAKRLFQLDAENVGERVVIPSVWVDLYNRQGVSVGRFEGGRSRIYPACSARFRVDVSDVPPGEYTALVILDNGDDHVMGAQYQMAIPK
jgi:hypothetical protein